MKDYSITSFKKLKYLLGYFMSRIGFISKIPRSIYEDLPEDWRDDWFDSLEQEEIKEADEKQ